MYEIMNVMILFSRPNIYFTIISYITVTLLSDIGRVYYLSISNDRNNVLFDMFLEENRPRVRNRRSDPTLWARRSCQNKVQRLLFKMLRGIYVSACYYFVPFLFLYAHQLLFVKKQFFDER